MHFSLHFSFLGVPCTSLCSRRHERRQTHSATMGRLYDVAATANYLFRIVHVWACSLARKQMRTKKKFRTNTSSLSSFVSVLCYKPAYDRPTSSYWYLRHVWAPADLSIAWSACSLASTSEGGLSVNLVDIVKPLQWSGNNVCSCNNVASWRGRVQSLRPSV